jgi:hypothetical protein
MLHSAKSWKMCAFTDRRRLWLLLPIAFLFLQPVPWLPFREVSARAAPQVAAARPLIDRFINAATGRTLVIDDGKTLVAGLADTAWVNPSFTVWTFRVHPECGLSAYEVALRFRQTAGRNPLGRILFRHLLGWRADLPASMRAPAPVGADSELRGVLPLDRTLLRFLLTKPDPHFPWRLTVPEASLCIDPWRTSDAGCGPFEIPTQLGYGRMEIISSPGQETYPEIWSLAEGERADRSPAPLMHVDGLVRIARAGFPDAADHERATEVRSSFWLPSLPAYCGAKGTVPPTAGSPFLAHFFLEVAQDHREHAAALRHSLMQSNLLPGAEKLGWHGRVRFLPGRRPADMSPHAENRATTPGAEGRRAARLFFPGGIGILRCLAERIRAVLLPAGWNVQLQEVSWQTLREVRADGDYDLILHLGITRKSPEAWEMLRMLAPWWSASATEIGCESSARGLDLPGEEWWLVERFETTLLEGGVLIPLLLSPVSWRLEAPSRPGGLRDGILPGWEEPRPPLVVRIQGGGIAGTGPSGGGDDSD